MTDKVFGRGHIAQLNSDPVKKKAVTVRKTIAQVESEAFARGYAKAVEDAAREAETHGEACGHGFDGDAGRCIAEDIRALTPEPKKDGGT